MQTIDNLILDFREASDGKFTTAQKLVPQCLDLCPVATIRRYFRKCWRFMDAYRFVCLYFLLFNLFLKHFI